MRLNEIFYYDYNQIILMEIKIPNDFNIFVYIINVESKHFALKYLDLIIKVYDI